MSTRSSLSIGTARLTRRLLLLGAAAATAAAAQPTFTKAFQPSTIGPGSASTLQFTITNPAATPVTDLAFTDIFPAGVTIASPASAATTCGVSATLTAPNGGSTVALSGGLLGGFASCTVTVNVTSSTIGTHTNVSGDLTSSAGNSGPASADLTVTTTRPGFSKVFSPDAVGLGGRSTLTFTIDNTANATFASSLIFTDLLPPGMVIASPSNAATDCTSAVLTASAGSSTVSILGGVLFAGQSCTVTVDVIGGAAGVLANVSGELTSSSGGPSVSSGKATDALTVTAGTVSIAKSFLDDPVNPGGTVTLQFTLTNRDRNEDATNIAFTDDLDATLTGLVATGLPQSNVCGPGSLLSGASVVSLTGGSLAADGGTCTFSLTLQVPAGAVAGAYPNTTSSLSADLGGSPFVGPPGTETLFVNDAPSLTKTFLTDPVGGGDTTTLQFTITNSSSTSAATNIAFSDYLESVASGVGVTLPAPGYCGGGSISSYAIGTGIASFLGGNLPPSGSCTFTVDLTIPPGAPAGTYLNTTSAISTTVDGTTQTGVAASDTLTIVSAPILRKEFTDDPVLPGNTVTLEFTIEHSETAPADATAIAFTDDLTATLSGLSALGLPVNDVCGTGSVLSGTTNLSLTGGVLAPGDTCVFSVTLQVPLAALPGQYTNLTSNVMATVSGIPTTRGGAQDQLLVAGLTFSKSFTDDPVLPGATVTLEFTIDNNSPIDDATGMSFTDNLTATLSGLAAVGLPTNDVCGLGSQISGTTNLTFTGGNLSAGTSCTFAVTLQVPGGAADGTYLNTTSAFSATLGGSPVVLPPARDPLTVESSLLALTKSFTDDPAPPGGTATLEFTVTNLDPSQAITGITFTDDLDATLSGLVAVGLPANDVCGLGSQVAGTSLLTLTGGNLAAGGSCTFAVTLQIPAGAPPGTVATNTTSGISGMLGGLPVNGDPATDTLSIEALTFAKAFDGLTAAGGTPVLTFTIANLSATATATDLGFTDDLNAVLPGLVATGLPLANPCGAGSTLGGTSSLALSGASLLPGGSCSIMVSLQVPAGAAPGTYSNTTSELFQAGLPVAAPATADLGIEPPPTFAKAFVPDSIALGSVATLLFTVDNSGSAIPAGSLAFTDNLPAGVLVASPANASTTCTGGTITAVAGTGVVGYSAGTVAAGASCTIQVDITAIVPGVFVNTTGDLTSSSGNSGTATDTLTVNPQPGFAKAFAPDPILVGGVSTLTFTIDNTASTVAATALDFTDNLPAGLVVATPANASTTCTGGTLTATPGSGVATYSGGTVGAGASCTVQLDTTATAAGALANTSGDLTSSLGNSGTASDTLTANAPPTFGKLFAPDTVPVGDPSTLTFTIDNTAATVAAMALDFTDNLPAGLVVATPANASTTCAGGTLTATPGSGVVTYTGGSVASGATCTIQVDTAATTTGLLVNTSGDLTSSLGNSGTASDTLTVVAPPLFAKVFTPDVTAEGEISTLTFTIDNSASPIPATALDFADNLPAGLVVATPAAASTTCSGGTITAAPGSAVVSYSGGSVAANGSCTVQVDVSAATAGTYLNTTGDLTSSFGNSGTATASLTIVGTIGFTKAFLSAPVLRGGQVQLEYTISNTSTAVLTAMAFTDDLGAVLPGLMAVGLPLVDPCGAGSTLSGTSVVTLSGGNLGPGASCVFTVTVQVPADAALGIVTSTSSLLTFVPTPAPVAGGGGFVAGPAIADLEVAFLAFSKVFDPQMATGGDLVTLTFDLVNPDPVNAVTGITFTDDLDAMIPGMVAVGLPTVDVCGVGSQVAGTSVVTLTGGSLAAGGSCSFAISVQVPLDVHSGIYTNLTSPLAAMVGANTVSGDPADVASDDLDVTGATLAIPTLGTWGLILLAGLLAGLASRRLRRA